MAAEGKVYLVGAGPGDPGLITAKGLKCLSVADLVLYDGLVNPLILLNTAAKAIRTCRVSTLEGKVLEQEEINRRLIEAARSGQTVVRLKGGDPFIFGRGGEEAAALRKANIPYEVVPGVTAATGAGAYTGIPLTHRGYASAVAFVTGHEDPQKPASQLDYAALATFPGTLVFYMGLHRLPEIASALIQAGKAGTTPGVVISRGTTPLQRTVAAPLEQLPEAVRQAGLRPPSLIVIGECVDQREMIGWFEQRPLFGQRIGIPRPIAQAAAVVERATEFGVQPILMPTIEILPPEDWTVVDKTLARLDEFDWLVFTSVNGVEALVQRLWETGKDIRCLGHLKLAAIGTATAAALAEYQLRADLIPTEFRGEALAEALIPLTTGKRVLWPRASRGRDVLPNRLRDAGIEIEEIVVYRNLDVDAFQPEVLAALEEGEIDWIGLSSPSIARNFKRLLSPKALAHLGKSVRLASISPVTTAAAREVDLPIDAEADVFTWAGIFEAIEKSGQWPVASGQ